MALKYQRILLKISGEALGGEKGMGFDEPTMDAMMRRRDQHFFQPAQFRR